MNKKLLVMTMCTALGWLPLSAQVTIEGSEKNYESISAAIADAVDGSKIHVSESYTEGKSILLNTNKEVTIIGDAAEGQEIVVSYHGIYVVSVQNVESSLIIENLTFKNSKPETSSTRSPFAIGKGKICMNNVTLVDANVNSATGVISLNGSSSNIKDAILNNVKIVNSTVTGAPAEVVVGNNNVTLKGNTELSVQLTKTNAIKSAAEFTGHATLVLDANRELGSAIVNECTDPTLFTLSGVEDRILKAEGDNLVLAETPAITVEGDAGASYTDLKTAIESVASGSTLIINKNISLTGSRIVVGGKTLTIKGATGAETISRGQNLSYHLVSLDENDNVTFENLIVDGNEAETTVPLFQTQKNAILNLNNVKIVNCKAVLGANHGLIENRTNGDGTWHLNGVKFDNCLVSRVSTADVDAELASEPLVTANLNGNTISGDNDLSLLICGNFTIDASGVENIIPVKVTFANPVLDQVYFLHCSDPYQFESTNSTYKFVADGGNLKLAEDKNTGIEDIDAENDAEAVWYNLNGVRVNPNTPGLYIKVQGEKASKIYVK